MILYQLLRPFSYLQIEHDKKFVFDWIIPAAFTTATVIFLWIFRENFLIFDGEGIISKTADFVQSLPGFYIAALAAIATFNRQDIDRYIPAPTPEIEIMVGGEKNIIKLTRRRFLCMLFAFLTAESILISVLGVIFSSTNPDALPIFTEFWGHIFCMIAAFFFFFLFWQMIVATALGLYYLGDRLQQPEP